LEYFLPFLASLNFSLVSFEKILPIKALLSLSLLIPFQEKFKPSG